MPPTPICNPGRATIAATLKPSKTNEIFFVADGRGSHIFSETLKEHNAAVANWRKAEKEMRARQAQAQAQAQTAAAQQAQSATVSAPAPAPAPVVEEMQVPAQVLAAEMDDAPTQQQPAGRPAPKGAPRAR